MSVIHPRLGYLHALVDNRCGEKLCFVVLLVLLVLSGYKVKYLLLDGEILAFRYVKSGPEMLSEEFEPVLGQLEANEWCCGH